MFVTFVDNVMITPTYVDIKKPCAVTYMSGPCPLLSSSCVHRCGSLPGSTDVTFFMSYEERDVVRRERDVT